MTDAGSVMRGAVADFAFHHSRILQPTSDDSRAQGIHTNTGQRVDKALSR